jgi:hypothetical protein
LISAEGYIDLLAGAALILGRIFATRQLVMELATGIACTVQHEWSMAKAWLYREIRGASQ